MVYDDANRNATRDPGETALGNYTMWVKVRNVGAPTAFGAVPVNTTDGTYTIPNLPNGTYEIFVDTNSDLTDVTPGLPAGWRFTGPPNGMRSETIAGANLANRDFGAFHGSTLSGVVFVDNGQGGGIEGDGLQNGTEPPLPGVTVTAALSNGVAFATTTTGPDGTYSFVLPGVYAGAEIWITETNPAGYQSVSGHAGNTGGTYTLTTDTVAFQMAAGMDYTGVNFGDDQRPTMAGWVYHDLNLNATRDTGEMGLEIPGLWIKAIAEGATTAYAATPVDPTTGRWLDTIPAGTYTLILDDNDDLTDITPFKPDGWLGTENPNQTIGPISHTATDDDLNMGLYFGSTITGVVFVDDGAGGGVAANGIQDGAEAPLPDVSIEAWTDEGELIGTAVTGPDGRYTLIIPGDCCGFVTQIIETNPPGYISVSGHPGTTGGTYDLATDTTTFTLTSGLAYTDVNFGDLAAETVQGYVYNDANHDAARTLGEVGLGLAGWFVKMYEEGETTASAAYPVDPDTGLWSGPAVGTSVYFILDDNDNLNDLTPSRPAGWIGTEAPQQIRGPVALQPGLEDQNFGLWHGSSVSGRVFVDNGEGGGTPADGLWNGAEVPIPDVRVEALVDGVTIGVETLTDADGLYTLFIPAEQAGAQVQIVQHNLAGYLSISGYPGTTGGTYDLATDTTTFTFNTGEVYVDVNFGDVPLPGLAGWVYLDANKNATRDAGEDGFDQPDWWVKVYAEGATEAFAAYPVDPATGGWSGMPEGWPTYDNLYLILDNNEDLTDLTPQLPAEYYGTEAPEQIRGPLNLSTGEVPGDQNFGLWKYSVIRGRVLIDDGVGVGGIRGDGERNGDEVYLAGVTITLSDANGVIQTVQTDPTGMFRFETDVSGEVYITETNPPGYRSISVRLGTTGGTYDITTDTVTFTLVSGEDHVGIYFGDVLAQTLQGYVYHDTNHDATRQPTEVGTGLDGWYVKVYDIGATEALAAYPVDPATGYWSGPDVGANILLILDDNDDLSDILPSRPAGWIGTEAPDQIIGPLAPTPELGDQNFGLYHGTTLTGTIFVDDGAGGGSPGDGLPNGTEAPLANVVVRAYNTASSFNVQTTTDADGHYTIWIPASELGGVITIEEENPTGYLSISGHPGNTGGQYFIDADTIVFTHSSTEPYHSVNFGDVPLPTLQGYVYLDANQNATREATETGLGEDGWWVKVYSGTDTPEFIGAYPVDPTSGYWVADLDGWPTYADLYLILDDNDDSADLTPACPAGYYGTEAPDQIRGPLSLYGGGQPEDQNFGLWMMDTIRGVVFVDDGAGGGTAGDGIPNGTEQVLEGVTVTLSDASGVLQTVLTDVNGEFVFTTMATGQLTITQTNLPGYESVSGSPGTTGGTYDLATDTVTFTKAAGTSYDQVYFGDLWTLGLGGYIYNDVNHNADRDAGEVGLGLSGWYVKVIAQGGTAALGAYPVDPATGEWWAQLPAGTYTVILDDNADLTDIAPAKPAGWLGTEAPLQTISDVVLGDLPIVNLDMGLYHGLRLSGRVFEDNGVGTGGIANNGVQDGSELGLPLVRVHAHDGAGNVLASTRTDNLGDWELWVAAAEGLAVLYITETNLVGYISTGGAPGDTGGAYDRPSDTTSFAPGWGAAYSGVTFADVRSPTFVADGQQQGRPGSVVFYPHTFTTGTAGTVTFSVSKTDSPTNPVWPEVLLYLDVNGDGLLDGGDTLLTGPLEVAAGDEVPILAVVYLPIEVPTGASSLATVRADFVYTNAVPPLSWQGQVHDLTTVTDGAGMTLHKAADKELVAPGEIITYTLTYTNGSLVPIENLVVADKTPTYTTYVSAAYTTPLPASLTGCTMTMPAVGAPGEMTWTFTGTLEPGSSGSVTYQVRVDTD